MPIISGLTPEGVAGRLNWTVETDWMVRDVQYALITPLEVTSPVHPSGRLGSSPSWLDATPRRLSKTRFWRD